MKKQEVGKNNDEMQNSEGQNHHMVCIVDHGINSYIIISVIQFIYFVAKM
jgi:PHD/YefM family antitoxin component YafN of YafNO toxin-antitoxin module